MATNKQQPKALLQCKKKKKKRLRKKRQMNPLK
jgi:hypothetical protein